MFLIFAPNPQTACWDMTWIGWEIQSGYAVWLRAVPENKPGLCDCTTPASLAEREKLKNAPYSLNLKDSDEVRHCYVRPDRL